jgi:catechol 2,3-dioxygenase-like lactoylglutathione lyase family enzyme
VGDLHLATVVLNVADMGRAVRFWTAALGYRARAAEWDAAFMMLEDPRGHGLPVSLQRTDDRPRQPVRVHLDLYTSEQDRQVRRLVELGATAVTEWTYPPGADFVVLRDPDGNEFCVIGHAELT